MSSDPTCYCGAAFTKYAGTLSTLVGYVSPPGHNHDDNCKRHIVVCAAGHTTKLHVRNKCNACEWKGKAECFCHEGQKLELDFDPTKLSTATDWRTAL